MTASRTIGRPTGTSGEPTLVALIDPERRMGTVTVVTPHEVTVNLRAAVAAWGRRNRAQGAVGEFVAIDCDSHVVLARIVKVEIPDRQRAALEGERREDAGFAPQGILQPVASVERATNRLVRGLAQAPRVGDPVYSLPEEALLSRLEQAMGGVAEGGRTPLLLDIGTIAQLQRAAVRVPPAALFGRHCGIFGATGGGKSWTIARLVEEIHRLGGKAILIDATGEYIQNSFGEKTRKVQFYTPKKDAKWQENCADHVSEHNATNHDIVQVYFPYREISEAKLVNIIKPSQGVQEPILRESIKYLKIIDLIKRYQQEGAVVDSLASLKQVLKYQDNNIPDYISMKGKNISFRLQLESEIRKHEHLIDIDNCAFEIHNLSEQMSENCVRQKNGSYIDDNKMKEYIQPLISRLETIISASEYRFIFDSKERRKSDLSASIIVKPYTDIFQEFLGDKNITIFVTDVSTISFKYNARETIIEIIGDYLMREARKGTFRNNPLIVILDEAHQFLGRDLGDRDRPFPLEAFGLIAKEGRKYGLSVVIATQRPRDVPQDVLSQLGTFIVHRLTSHHDRDVIERACGEFERGLANFLPSLTPGEALLLGVDLPVALPVHIRTPSDRFKPQSTGPDFAAHWASRGGDLARPSGPGEGSSHPRQPTDAAGTPAGDGAASAKS